MDRQERLTDHIKKQIKGQPMVMHSACLQDIYHSLANAHFLVDELAELINAGREEWLRITRRAWKRANKLREDEDFPCKDCNGVVITIGLVEGDNCRDSIFLKLKPGGEFVDFSDSDLIKDLVKTYGQEQVYRAFISKMQDHVCSAYL